MIKRSLLVGGLVLYLAYIVMPIILILVGSFGEKWFGTLFPQGFTWRWYIDLFSRSMYLRALKMRLIVGALSVAINSFISICTAYAVSVLDKRWLKSLVDFLVLLPVAIPPVVMGLGLIQAFNWPSFSWVGTVKLLVGAHLIYTLPFMLRPIVANFELIDWRTMEEAGLSLGAHPLFLARKILIPNVIPGIISGALMTFSMSLGEFQLAAMVTGSATQTHPVVLYQAFYVSTGFACAATVLLVAISIFSLAGLLLLGKFFGFSSSNITMGGA